MSTMHMWRPRSKALTRPKRFLLKLGFNLVFNKSSLWVHVLHSKCGMKEIIPESITRGSCLAMWREIAKVRPLLKESLCWSIGTRTEVHCWKDNWVPKVGPLIEHVQTPNRPTTNCMLKDMVAEKGHGTWKNLEKYYQKKSYKRL